MVNPDLEKALEEREILHVNEDGIDVRLYDTGQCRFSGKVARERQSTEGNKTIIEKIEVPASATYNLRNNSYSYWIGDHGGSGYDGREGFCFPRMFGNLPPNFLAQALRIVGEGYDIDKWQSLICEHGSDPNRYPELAGFVSKIHKSLKRVWPIHLISYFSEIGVFDFEKGRKKLEKEESYMSPEEGKSYDGNAVLVRPCRLVYLYDTDARHHSTIDTYFFNPAHYQKFLEGKLKVENPLPSMDDWIFNVTYGIEGMRKWLHFNADKFHPRDEERHLLAEQGKNDIYLKADDQLVKTLERIAPLPL